MRVYKDFEDFLADKFARGEGASVLDDEFPEAFDDWVTGLDVNDVIKWADEFAKYQTERLKDKLL